ncbi:hypothetical protein EDM53_05745 [Rickettsiales endosymbiont of Peranema trichophorum]|uniref:hypothetical protein n=1 Tax=Rickettsiales endosymbiont of Peranema trichophorum TaxID=2486577 RepID=UPI001023E998|nr:hypothetical protein [Rickettsiales endosymbiont of Peranema trichophorum]RZI45163.1 hypothetical protein EDM53_05745 [Rickettsiales endosymbiont of Peranema trichophorum]
MPDPKQSAPDDITPKEASEPQKQKEGVNWFQKLIVYMFSKISLLFSKNSGKLDDKKTKDVATGGPGQGGGRTPTEAVSLLPGLTGRVYDNKADVHQQDASTKTWTQRLRRAFSKKVPNDVNALNKGAGPHF